MEGKRAASHAGSWYSGSKSQLNSQLEDWLAQAEPTQPPAKAIIGPHAGFSYSGPTAAWAYKHISSENFKRVFLLGPSHHVYIPGCALPCSAEYQTPIGDISVDLETVRALSETSKFYQLDKDAEEDEHSLEMHLPYIRKAFEGKEIKLVPIMVGNLKESQEAEYGSILAPYLQDPQTLFVVSSDFCHWGPRFGYNPYDSSKGEIWQSIEAMDRQGMALIETQDPASFRQYLSQTKNTICGRHPISLFLSTLQTSGLSASTKFVRYAQSEKVTNPRGSSVSYASSVTYLN